MDISVCMCEDLKVIMIGIVSYKYNPKELYDKLEYLCKVERNIEDYLDYKVKLLDCDTTIKKLKKGRYK